MKHKPENEVAKHRRKKGNKPFIIQKKMTTMEAERRTRNEQERIAREMKWTDGYTKYETRKAAEQALEKINKQKRYRTDLNMFCYHVGYDHKIVDKSETKT